MAKNYVQESLNNYLNESKTVILKRKYGERPTVVAGTQAPLRDRVLSYVSENVKVLKSDLKNFIVGLSEGRSKPVAANMFMKRNKQFFVTESKNGETYFKLSDIGKRIVSRITKQVEQPLTEGKKEDKKETKIEAYGIKGLKSVKWRKTFKNEKEMKLWVEKNDAEIEGFRKLNERIVEDWDIDGYPEERNDEPEENDFRAKEIDMDDDLEYHGRGGEDDFEKDFTEFDEPEDNELDNLDDEDALDNANYEFDDEDLDRESEEQELEDIENMDDEEREEHMRHEENETPEEEEMEHEMNSNSKKPFRQYDFMHNGRTGIYDMEESVDESLNEDELPGEVFDVNMETDENKPAEEVETTPAKEESEKETTKTPEKEEETGEKSEEDEKVEITEFILTVDDPEEAIAELDELGIPAERVPLEEDEKIEGEEEKEFKEDQIKVPATSWNELRSWLESKGLDISTMFGGEIETEYEEDEANDDDINFDDITDDEEIDDNKEESKESEKENENEKEEKEDNESKEEK